MRGHGRFWLRWALTTAAGFGVVWLLLALLGTDPRPERLLLLVVLVMAVLALVNLGVVTEGPDWEVVTMTPVTEPGQDARLAMYARVIGGHLDARQADPALRDRLAAIADRRLRQRHGTDLHAPAAAGLLGPEVSAVLTGPPRRLGRREIEQCVRAIEEL